MSGDNTRNWSREALRPLPRLESEEEAARFVEEADLTRYDLSSFRPVRFEFARKTARVTMRLPESLLAAIKAETARRRMPYQRFMRELLERGLATD